MRAFKIVLQQLSRWMPNARAVRQQLLDALQAALDSGRLTPTELGRHMPGSEKLKVKVKKMYRWLTNPAFIEKGKALFRALAHCLLDGVGQPLLLADWTVFGDHYLLCCGLVHDGRALPIYLEVRPLSEFGKPKTEREWLETLRRDILPVCQPVLCTDAGFRSDWFDDVERLGFHYIGRLQPGVKMQPVSATADVWLTMDVLGFAATKIPEDMGQYLVCKGDPVQRRVVRYHGTVARGPSQQRGPSPKGGPREQKYRRQAERGWVLVTSLSPPEADAALLIAMYTQRMQIEEMFRSIKSEIYGQGLGESHSQNRTVVANLWKLACLRAVVLQMVGFVAEEHDWHKDYQTNTSERRVLSLPFLGQLVLEHQDMRQLTPNRMQRALDDIRQAAQRPTNSISHISNIAQSAQSPALAA